MALSLNPIPNRDTREYTLSEDEDVLDFPGGTTRPAAAFLETFKLDRHNQRGTFLSFEMHSRSLGNLTEAISVEFYWSYEPITDAAPGTNFQTFTLPSGTARTNLSLLVEGRLSVSASGDGDSRNVFRGKGTMSATGATPAHTALSVLFDANRDLYFGIRVNRANQNGHIAVVYVNVKATFGVSHIRRRNYDPNAVPRTRFD